MSFAIFYDGKMITQNYLLPILLKHNQMRGFKGEAAICAEIAGYLKEESLYGRLPYIWFHVPNEFSGQYRGAFGAKQHSMGKICGIPDYAFLGKDGCFFVEVKYGKNDQSESQKIVQKWCEDVGVRYYLCRSLEDVKKILSERTAR